MIVDYDYYEDTYKGDKIPQSDFERIELRASNQVEMFIMGKDYTNWNNQNYTEQIKMATCSVADVLYDAEEKKKILDSMSDSKSKIVTSEKVANYSKNYATASYKDLKDEVSNDNIKRLIRRRNKQLFMEYRAYE